MKDLFVDNNITKNFCNPLSEEYKLLVRWLFDEGALVVSKKLIAEYRATSGHSRSATSIGAILAVHMSDGRLHTITRQQLRGFKIPKRLLRRLRSNSRDHDHIKTVLLSRRKLAISADRNLRHDLNNFPGHQVRAVRRPSDIDYR